jgi:MazG family protein
VTEGKQVAGHETGAALLRLIAVMDRLRSECPWDARPTHQSLAPFLLEETYETLDALDRGDLDELRGELGDVLLQVLFHSKIASERTDATGFTIDDVAGDIADKLIRRHPHVFADVSVSGADEVKKNWDQIKAEERAAAGRAADSVLDSVPMSQPALSLAAQLQHRAERAGAPALAADLATAQTVHAAGAADRPAGAAGRDDAVSEIGAELFALVARARAAGLDPELELRRAARVYRDRVRAWEAAGTGGVPT